MLERLREQIASQIRSRNGFPQTSVSRTICVPLSADFKKLQAAWEEFYPRDPAVIAQVQPWLEPIQENDAFEKAASAQIRDAFKATVAQELIGRAIFLRPFNLVVFIGDLNAPEMETVLTDRSVIIERLIRPFRTPQTQVISIGIFLVDTDAAAGSADFQSLLQSRFDRVFLLDTRNNAGDVLSPADREHLVIQALRLLERLPESFTQDERFTEWLLRSSAHDGFVAAVGACRVFLPTQQMLELANVLCGAKLLNRSLLTAPDEYHAFYSNNLIRQLSMVNAADVRTELRHAIPDPLAAAPDSSGFSEQQRLERLRQIDSGLASVADACQTWLSGDLPKRLATWKLIFEEHLDSVINAEIGGFEVASHFVASILKHVFELGSPSFQGSTEDVGPLFRNAQKNVEKLPDPVSLSARTVLGSAAVVAAVFAVPASHVVTFALCGGALAVLIGLAALLRHSRQTRWERHLSKLRTGVGHKWEAMIEPIIYTSANTLLRGFAEYLKGVAEELKQSIARITELSQWVENNYTPVLFQPTAVMMPIVQTRPELKQFVRTCSPSRVLPPSEIFEPKTFAWRRLALPGTSEPTAFEWDSLERAAFLCLGDCAHIADIKLLEVLAQRRELLDQVRQKILVSTEPYLARRPGSGQPDSSAFLEAASVETDMVLPELKDKLGKQFTQVSALPKSSPAELVVTNVWEHVHFSDINSNQ